MKTDHRTGLRVAAFSLVELLVAMSITVLIVVLLSTVFVSASEQWRSSDQRIDVFRDARAAMQVIAHDLSRANLHAAPNMLTLANHDPGGTYAQEAYAIAPLGNGGKSDLCAVGYYLDWSARTKTYTLKRLFKESDETTLGLQGATLNLTTLFTKGAADEDLAAYVWDLEFRPGELAQPLTPTTDTPAQWKWLEVRFKAMSPNAARKLGNSSVTQDTWLEQPPSLSAAYKSLILPSEQQFVTRIWLNQNQ